MLSAELTACDARHSRSLERGLAILGCFTPATPVLGIADVAERLDLNRSTAHRYMTTLVALGYLQQEPTRGYRLALHVADLGMSALNTMSLREQANRYLHELCARCSYTTSLAVLDGPEILCVDRVRGPRSERAGAGSGLAVGTRLPAYCTALGKLLLAHLSPREQRTLLGETKLVRRGPNAITSRRALRAELQQILTAGFAVADGELQDDLRAIAAPVRSEAREVVAALGISAPAAAISREELVGLAPHLISSADRISARLGYRRRDERRHDALAPSHTSAPERLAS